MKLLVLSPVFPDSPSDGDRLRLFHLLRELGGRHELHLLCFADPARSEDWGESGLGGKLKSVRRVAMPRWRRWVNAGLRAGTGLPANVNAYESAEMAALVDEAGEYEAVLAYRLRMAPYALRFRGPRYLDYCDSMTRYAERLAAASEGLRRRIWQAEARKLAAYEAFCAGQFDAGFFNSGQDRDAVLGMAPGSPLYTAPNGVSPGRQRAGRPRSQVSPRLLFVGQLAYAPNADAVRYFAREVFPLVRAERPDARFVVVGAGAPTDVAALAGQPGIEFTGYLPDTLPELSRASVVVCPVRLGAGRQNKLLEAFAAGVPAVATALAAEGAEAVDGVHCLVAGGAQAFAKACLRLIRDPRLAARLAGQARRLVKEKYQWSKNARDLESKISTLAAFMPPAGKPSGAR